MADIHNKVTRSFNMSQIKSKNTKPEILVRKLLFSKGLRFRLHSKELPGKPDIILPKYKTVIFVNGCFWHGHENCKYFVIPKSNTDFWMQKIRNNKIRDVENYKKLKSLSWKVFTIFECEIKTSRTEHIIDEILNQIH